MSPEAQRIAIAEACGFTKCDTGDGCWLHPTTLYHHTLQGKGGTERLPNYLSDLNAMHAVEEILTGGLGSAFAHTLHALLCQNIWGDFPVIHASATHRAEAFLRALSLWDDSK